MLIFQGVFFKWVGWNHQLLVTSIQLQLLAGTATAKWSLKAAGVILVSNFQRWSVLRIMVKEKNTKHSSFLLDNYLLCWTFGKVWEHSEHSICEGQFNHIGIFKCFLEGLVSSSSGLSLGRKCFWLTSSKPIVRIVPDVFYLPLIEAPHI